MEYQEMQGMWTIAEPMEQTRITPEPGVYVVKVEDVQTEWKDTKKGRQPCMTWTFEITEGNNLGSRFEKRDWLSNTTACGILKGTMKKLGVPIPKTFGDIDVSMQYARGAELQVEVRQNGEFRNVYIQKVLATQVQNTQTMRTPTRPMNQAPAQKPVYIPSTMEDVPF